MSGRRVDGADPTPATVRQVVTLAGRAPSLHNSQPWRWRLGTRSVELYVDRERHLPCIDPTGRGMIVSCGAALHHVVVAARGLGLTAQVTLLPDGGGADLLARVELAPGEADAESTADLLALGSRRTDRRRFTSWPVSEPRLSQLVGTAETWGPRAVAVVGATARWRLDTLVAQAQRHRSPDPARSLDPDEPADDLDPADGVIVLGGPSEERAAWLATGAGLSAMWIRAERGGLSLVPLTQPMEVAETRNALAVEVLAQQLVPHLVVRVGWLPIGRRQFPRTPRHPLADLLRA